MSKWERGISCPDITLFIPLAKLLDVSASELLIGKQKINVTQEAAEAIVDETLNYSKKRAALKMEKTKQYFLF